MSVQTVGFKLVELCSEGKNFDVMRTMYAPDAVSVEADGKETFGQEAIIKKSGDWALDKIFHGKKLLGPYFNGPEQFAVHFTLDITPNASGERVSVQEVAVYTVKNDKIAREQFFYVGPR